MVDMFVGQIPKYRNCLIMKLTCGIVSQYRRDTFLNCTFLNNSSSHRVQWSLYKSFIWKGKSISLEKYWTATDRDESFSSRWNSFSERSLQKNIITYSVFPPWLFKKRLSFVGTCCGCLSGNNPGFAFFGSWGQLLPNPSLVAIPRYRASPSRESPSC